MFAAVLSDLDGVLVDSGAAVERVWREWAVEQGLDPDDVGRASHGVPGRQVIERVAPHLDAVAEAERVDRLHAVTGRVALPGAAELLACAGELRLGREAARRSRSDNVRESRSPTCRRP